MFTGLQNMDIKRNPVLEDTLSQNGIRQVLESDGIEFMFRKHEPSVTATNDRLKETVP